MEPTAAAVVEVVPRRRHHRLHGHRDVEAGPEAEGHAAEAGRRDPHHRHRMTVDAHRLADDVGVARETVAPELVIEDDQRVGAGRGLVGHGEDAAGGGAHAEQLEVVARDQLGGGPLGGVRPADVDLGPEAAGDAVEDVVALAVVLEHRVRDRRSIPRLLPECEPRLATITSESGSRTGSRRSSTWSNSVKMAVLAPIPSASEITAIAVKPGERRSERRANRRSRVMRVPATAWRPVALGSTTEDGGEVPDRRYLAVAPADRDQTIVGAQVEAPARDRRRGDDPAVDRVAGEQPRLAPATRRRTSPRSRSRSRPCRRPPPATPRRCRRCAPATASRRSRRRRR